MPAALEMSRIVAPSKPFWRNSLAETRNSSSRRFDSLLRRGRGFVCPRLISATAGGRPSRRRCRPISWSGTVGARFQKGKCLVQFRKTAACRGRGGGVFGQFLQLVLAGIAQGCVYALVA